MTLHIKKDGTTMWRGLAIGTTKLDERGQWLFTADLIDDRVPHLKFDAKKMRLRNDLTRWIVAREREQGTRLEK